MLPRRIPFNQIAFATLLGVGGGIYIYKPMFERHREPKRTPNEQNIKWEAEGGGHENIAKQATSVTNPGATLEAAAAK